MIIYESIFAHKRFVKMLEIFVENMYTVYVGLMCIQSNGLSWHEWGTVNIVHWIKRWKCIEDL